METRLVEVRIAAAELWKLYTLLDLEDIFQGFLPFMYVIWYHGGSASAPACRLEGTWFDLTLGRNSFGPTGTGDNTV